MIMPKPIIGLSGTFASGKDTLADYLVERCNFMHLSTGDLVREEAMRLRGSVERPVLFEVANQLRREKGAGVIIQIALERFAAAPQYDGIVISGIRSIGEVEAVHAAGGRMVFVDAPVEVRYNRMASRQRDKESLLSLEEFRAGEEKESHVDPSDKTIQNLPAMKEMADIRLDNSGELQTFIDTALQALALTK